MTCLGSFVLYRFLVARIESLESHFIHLFSKFSIINRCAQVFIPDLFLRLGLGWGARSRRGHLSHSWVMLEWAKLIVRIELILSLAHDDWVAITDSYRWCWNWSHKLLYVRPLTQLGKLRVYFRQVTRVVWSPVKLLPHALFFSVSIVFKNL